MGLNQTQLERKTNEELIRFVLNGDVAIGDRAFSRDFDQPVFFDGITFRVFCGCDAVRVPVEIITGIRVNSCCLQVNGCQLVIKTMQ